MNILVLTPDIYCNCFGDVSQEVARRAKVNSSVRLLCIQHNITLVSTAKRLIGTQQFPGKNWLRVSVTMTIEGELVTFLNIDVWPRGVGDCRGVLSIIRKRVVALHFMRNSCYNKAFPWRFSDIYC